MLVPVARDHPPRMNNLPDNWHPERRIPPKEKDMVTGTDR